MREMRVLVTEEDMLRRVVVEVGDGVAVVAVVEVLELSGISFESFDGIFLRRTVDDGADDSTPHSKSFSVAAVNEASVSEVKLVVDLVLLALLSPQ